MRNVIGSLLFLCLMGAAAQALVIDDFEDGSLSEYVLTNVMGTAPLSWSASSGKVWVLCSAYTDITQAVALRDDYYLGIGQMLKVDTTGYSSGDTTGRNIGLVVAATKNQSGRKDYINVFMGPGATTISTRGFNGTAEFTNVSTGVSGGFQSMFIERTSATEFVTGYYKDGTRTDLTTRTITNTSIGNAIGFYTDIRSNNTIGGMDNLEISNPLVPYGPSVQQDTPSGTNVPTTLKWKAASDPNGVYPVNPNIVDQYVFMGTNADPNLRYVGATGVDPGTTNPDSELSLTRSMDTIYYWAVVEAIAGYQQTFSIGNVISLVDPNNIVGPTWSYESTKSSPTIVTQPTNQTVDKGQDAVFTIVVNTTSPETYTWYKSLDNANNTPADDTEVGYASTLTLNSVTGINEGYYFCKVVNGATPPDNVTYSNVVKLVVRRQVAYWKLDNDSYLGSLCEDFSGEGHHADPNGTPGFPSGVKDNAITCDPNEGFANAGTWNPSNLSGQLTACCWVKWNGSTGNQVILSKANNWTGATLMWELFCGANGYIQFIGGPALPAGTLKVNEWQFIAVSFNGTTATLYSLPASSTSLNFVTASQAYTFGAGVNSVVWIGARGVNDSTTPVEQFTGLIDEVQLFNYAKDVKAVADLYREIYPAKKFCLETYPSQYDYDNNCEVDLGDFALLAAEWLSCGMYPDSTCQ